MKNVFPFTVSMIILSLFISSCSNSEADEIILEKSNYEVPEEGGNVTIDIKSNVPYDVIITDNWIKRRKANTRGLENNSLVLEVEKNRSGDVRNGIVKIVYKAGSIEKAINIHQAFSLNFSIQEKSFEFDEHGGEASLSFSCNADVDLVCDDWIELKEKSTEEDKVVQKFRVKAIDKRQKSRDGVIKFKTSRGELNEKITIKQSSALYIIEESLLEMYIGEECKLPLINDTGTDVIWESSDKSIVDVEDGTIKIIKEGKAEISIATSNGNHRDAITIDAKDIVSTLSCEYGTFVTGTGISIEVYITCTIKNNSNRKINVTNVKVHWGSGFVKEPNEDSDIKLGELLPKDTTYITFGEYVIGSNKIEDDITFEWFFTFNGKEYIYNCPYHLDERLY